MKTPLLIALASGLVLASCTGEDPAVRIAPPIAPEEYDRLTPLAEAEDCEPFVFDPTGLFLHEAEDAQERTRRAACAVHHAEAIARFHPGHVDRHTLLWLLAGHERFGRSLDPARLAAARLTKEEVLFAAGWAHNILGMPEWTGRDGFGCEHARPPVDELVALAAEDDVSRLCARLIASGLDPDDAAGLHARFPFSGRCPDLPGGVTHDVLLLPARLAAQQSGDRQAFACLLEPALRSHEDGRYLLPDEIALMHVGHELGLVDDAAWAQVEARDGAEFVEMGRAYARQHYAAVLGEAG